MKDTPKYSKPPVLETVIGVQFPEIPGFQSVHFGLYWETIREGFASFQEQPRIPPAVEQFPRNPFGSPGLLLTSGHAANRMWYTSAGKNRLLQVQPDRFLYNWRAQPTSQYTTYEENNGVFLKEFEGFCRFCLVQGLEQPVPNLCEVTYVNHIDPEEGESASELFGRVFTGLRWELSEGLLPTPEAASFNRVYVIGEQLGRLYAEASIAYPRTNNAGSQEFVVLRMTGRVNHPQRESTTVADSLHLAHDWVVNGFAAITDPQIQRDRWERIT